MKQKLLCLCVALLCGLVTTNVVNADGAVLNEAVAKIEAVGKMIADLKTAAVKADAAAEEAGAVLAGAVKVAVSPTRSAPHRYATLAHPPAPAYYPAVTYRAVPRFVRPVVHYPYYPGYYGYGYYGYYPRWCW